MVTAVFSAYSLLALAALLATAYHKPWMKYYPWAKGAASLGFLLVALSKAGEAWLGAQRPCTGAPGADATGWRPLLVALSKAGEAFRGGGGYFLGLLACLALCAAGDVLLGLANVHAGFFSRFFLAGAVCFTLAHAGFCLVFGLAAGWHPAEFLLPLALVGAAALAARDKKRFRLKRMAVPALFYSFFVGLMCAQSVVYALRTGVWLAAAGGVLFLASDCVLLFLYFYYKKRAAFRALNLITYYLGMLCLALTI